MHIHNQNKNLIHSYRAGLYDLDAGGLEQHIAKFFATDAIIHMTNPFEDLTGPKELYGQVYAPLVNAIPDLERRDYIVIAGTGDGSGLSGDWVGCCGFYTGVFKQPWLDIPPTQHPITMRFHEFYRIEDNQIVEMQAVWDIPEVMMQANAWPMTPSLGVEWLVPSPATQDGLSTLPYDEVQSNASRQIIDDMVNGLERHKEEGAKAMGLEAYWHPKMLWYGPAGIGTNRQIEGFRNWHQIPFLKALPDRTNLMSNAILFADANFVGVTGWPDMQMTVSGDGWLGIAPANQEITMRSLDFWRCENGMIRENWVLVDLLHLYDQLGVDVFSRMRELTYARQPSARQPSQSFNQY